MGKNSRKVAHIAAHIRLETIDCFKMMTHVTRYLLIFDMGSNGPIRNSSSASCPLGKCSGSMKSPTWQPTRSEERRVGKGGRCGRGEEQDRKEASAHVETA